MTLRNYSSSAAQTTLAAGVDASTSALTVSATTGFPATPFVLAIDAGAAAQELVLVTNVAGTTLTVTRAFDSTVASAHDTGAVVVHSHAATDFREANTHVNATSGVHGASGAIVGATDAQTLTNKDLSSATNTFPSAQPRGVLGYAGVTANQGGITGATDLTGLSVAVTVGAGRRIRITGITPQVTSTVAGDVMGLLVMEGGTQLTGAFATCAAGGLNGQSMSASLVLAPSAGAHTYKLQMLRTSGTGTVTMTAASNAPAYIIVEDIGAA